jgi:sRNA-binding protein
VKVVTEGGKLMWDKAMKKKKKKEQEKEKKEKEKEEEKKKKKKKKKKEEEEEKNTTISAVCEQNVFINIIFIRFSGRGNVRICNQTVTSE